MSEVNSNETSNYVVLGTVKDNEGNPIKKVKIQAMNSDHRLLEYHNDEILGNVWSNSDGTFKIQFTKQDFHASLFEKNPDLYLIIRNLQGQIIQKTEIRKGVKPSDTTNLTFNIILDSKKEPVKYSTDPYSDSLGIMMSSFGKLRDSVTVHRDDWLRILEDLMGTVNDWILYTNEHMWKEIGYDGPQVPRYPWKQDDRPHHQPLWNKK